MTYTIGRITYNPQVMGGQPCIRGFRIPVSLVVRMVAAGMSVEQIMEHYPDLDADDIKASLDFAAMLAEERVLELTKADETSP